MWSDGILASLEDATQLIARLDTRISASPLSEAWQVRACFYAADTLAAIDGTPTRIPDILGLLTGTNLPHVSNYAPALAGFGHWRRCMARVELTDLASRIVGRTLTTSAQAAEHQADWDLEEKLPAAGRKTMLTGTGFDLDEYAWQVSERALRHMRESEVAGARLWSAAKQLQTAIRVDPDPDFFERVHYVQQDYEAQIRARAAKLKRALPSPADDGKLAQIEEQVRSLLTDVRWEKQSHLGACFSVLPDRLQEMGVTANRLGCLTGATKRLGFEGRLDERAFRGFLNQLSQDAQAGLAILDTLEALLSQFAGAPETKFDARSQLPEILYAFLLFPAVDAVWLQTALHLQERVVQKFIKRLADGKLVAHWSERRPEDPGSREVRLWTAAIFKQAYELALHRQARPSPPSRPTLGPAEILTRARDVDLSVPMSTVFQRFENEMLDIDREFGRFFNGKLGKKSGLSEARTARF